MLKCNSCGAANEDGQKFCSECGNKLVAVEQPAAEAVSETAATEKVCPACGTKNGADEKFCSECGKPLNTETAKDEEPKKQPKNKFVGTVVGVKDKTMAFENKHHIIANALIAVMALVFILVALLAPVKYTWYVLDGLDDMSGFGMNGFNSAATYDYGDFDFDDGDLDADIDAKLTLRAPYIQVNQSIFNAIGAAQAITLDLESEAGAKKALEYLKEYNDAMEKAEEEFEKWCETHESELMDAMLSGDTDKIMKVSEKYYSKYLSKVNLLRIDVINFKIADLESRYDDSDVEDEVDTLVTMMMNTIISLALGSVATILALVIAIVALVYLIKSIIAIVKKTPSNNGFFKMLCTVMGIAAAAVAVLGVAPTFKTGGGMFAIMLVSAVLAIVFGGISSLVNKIHNPLAALKNAIIGIVLTVAYFLLCTDIIAVKTTVSMFDMSATTTVYGPLGYALYSAFGFMGASIGTMIGESGGSGYYMGAVMSGYVVGLLMCALVASIGSGLAKRLRYNACGLVTRKNGTTVRDAYGTRALIGGLVVGVIGTLFAFIGSPIMFKTMASSSIGGIDAKDLPIVVSYAVRAQVIVSMVFTLVALIFSAVFKTENFGKKKEEKPATEEAAA